MATLSGHLDFDLPTAGKPCATWYEIHGDLSTARPLIVLHGGPGIPHYYLGPIARLATTHKIPVVLYDQLGCGNSTHLPEKNGDVSFWTIQLFLDELENLIRGLGITEYDLLGHSWGAILASEHAVRQPPGLRRLILFSPPSSMKLWVEAANRLRLHLPQAVQDSLSRCEEKGDYESEEYHVSVDEFYKRFLCRTQPTPAELAESFEALGNDTTVYMTMNGPSEFNVTGVIKDWSIIDRVHLIDCPTLLINGYYDEAQNSVVQPYFDNLKDVTWVKFAESSHMACLEERDSSYALSASF
ncbi:proline-specific peptidase [Exidia glandulosa HHB12029]|uniref:Proline-specific peptidase n=1 Tax=Exidia glandulosa HHB12029 TaxID=1314781 RepID=A0A165DZK9_EXIGL|nr:proline-specific peptidase [Exidia glandulosa HHB12029]